MSEDPYFKLRPGLPTPPEEMCHCQGYKPLKLMGRLSYNPISCIDCNLEINPEFLGTNERLVEAIACWRDVHNAIEELWLDSREYEAWAKQQLTDIDSPVNRRGLELRKELEVIRPFYYHYFQDESAEGFQPTIRCPKCHKAFILYRGGIFLQFICESCRIITVGERPWLG
jgi:predicted  nucleic acid-binding Zn ribbon protein